MEDLLTNGVELSFAQYGKLLLALDVELDDVGVGGVDQGFDLAGIHGEHLRFTVSAQYAGDEALAAYGFGGLLAELGTFGGLYRNGFHDVFVF